jgi:diaminopimelate epimerase
MNHFYYPKTHSNAFVKYHGNANDFIIFDSDMVNSLENQWYSKNAKLICNRNRGIGADGLIVLSRKDDSIEMTIFNADGTEAKNCGNGLRCAAAYIFNRSNLSEITIKLAERDYFCKRINNKISVAMGECHIVLEKDLFLKSCGQFVRVAKGFIGNEHLLFLLDQPVSCFDEMHKEIKSRINFTDNFNIGFVFKKNTSEFFSSVFERGVGFTNSCATGACAAASFIAYLYPHYLKEGITINQPGGDLLITISVKTKAQREAVFTITQIGDAKEVFYGSLPSDGKLLDAVF